MSVVPIEQTLKYMNEARTNPSKFAEYVKKELTMFINHSTLPLKPGCNYSTNEGQGAWKEAIAFLAKQPPLAPFILNQGLSLAAQDHAIDMAKTGIFGHNSSNGASFSDRINKRCGQSYGSSGENIGSDFKVEGRNHALETVKGLIIDDGVSSRGHRKNIFSKDFKYVGISSRVQDDKIITVIDFHSENLSLKNAQQNNSSTGSNLQYEQKGGKQQPSNQGFGFGNGGNQFVVQGDWGNNDGWEKNDGWGQQGFSSGGQISSNQGEKKIISKSTNTKSHTSNGVKTTIKTTKIKYSDGTEQEQIEETTTH